MRDTKLTQRSRALTILSEPPAYEPENLTPEQLAALSGYALQTLSNWRCLGIGPRYIRVRGKKGEARFIRYPYRDWLKWAARHRVRASHR